ncbi:MAG: tetratricopeptide repeat protein [Polyangiaceae bacterium]
MLAAVDTFARDLKSERLAACEAAHVRGAQTEEILRLQTLCLDQRELRLAALLQEFEHAGPAMIERAVEATEGLPRVEGCRDEEALLRAAPPPEDPETIGKAKAIQDELARAGVLLDAARPHEALEIAEAQLTVARALEHPPALADAAYEVGRALIEIGSGEQLDRADALLREAGDLAERAQDDTLAAECWTALVRLSARRSSDKEMGYRHAEKAFSAIERSGSDPALRVRALHETGILCSLGGRTEDAERTLRDAVDLAEKNEVGAMLRADGWRLLAGVLRERGRFAEAREAFETVAQIERDTLGEEHPRLASTKHDHALFLLEQGDTGGARRLLQQAIAIHARALADDDLRRSRPLTALGILEDSQERYAESLSAHEQALAVQLRAVGDGDLLTVRSRGHIAQALLMLRRMEDAGTQLDLYEQGIDRHLDALPRDRALACKLRGQWWIARADRAQAIATLTRGRALVEGSRGDPLDLAEIHWLLSRAYLESGARDQVRGRMFAGSARALFAAGGSAGERRERALDGWLRAAR